MNILTKFWDALQKLLPFLAEAAERTFNDLSDAAKSAGINGSLFAQIIKENTHAAVDDIRALVKSKLGLSDDELTDLEEALQLKYNIPTERSVIGFLQIKFADATDDILHSSLAFTLSAIASIVLSKGKLSWLTLSMGLGEYFFRKYVKGADVAVLETPKCPVGYVWNGSSCVPDVG